MNKKVKKIFTDAYDKYVDKIYRFIYLKVNSKETAQDITSDVFLKFFKILERSGVVGDPKPLLFKIAKDFLIDHYRQNNQFKIISLESLNDPPVIPEFDQKVDMDIKMEKIKTALSQLDQDYQDVIILHYLDDLSIPETAKILNKSEGATRVLLSRALERLRNVLFENEKK
jgi:RNA polymerase sigma-70 factor (ECF subfamily)